MTNLDTKVAKGLLYVISFAVIYKIVEFCIVFLAPGTAAAYPLGVYTVSAAVALVGALIPLRHFFPDA